MLCQLLDIKPAHIINTIKVSRKLRSLLCTHCLLELASHFLVPSLRQVQSRARWDRYLQRTWLGDLQLHFRGRGPWAVGHTLSLSFPFSARLNSSTQERKSSLLCLSPSPSLPYTLASFSSPIAECECSYFFLLASCSSPHARACSQSPL